MLIWGVRGFTQRITLLCAWEKIGQFIFGEQNQIFGRVWVVGTGWMQASPFAILRKCHKLVGWTNCFLGALMFGQGYLST